MKANNIAFLGSSVALGCLMARSLASDRMTDMIGGRDNLWMGVAIGNTVAAAGWAANLLSDRAKDKESEIQR